MRDYLNVAGMILLTLIFATAAFVAIRRNRPVYSGMIPSTSLCCRSLMRPIGWTEDGWTAACRACGSIQYLGDDHENPPYGFRANGSGIVGCHAGGHVYSFSRLPAPRPAANRPDDAKVVGPDTLVSHSGEFRSRHPGWEENRTFDTEVTSAFDDAPTTLWDSNEPLAAYRGVAVNDEPLALPPQPNIGGVDHPEYKGPHYDVAHDQFVPYDMLSDPIPGTAVHKVGNVAVAGPIGKSDEDNKRPD